jgi:hypothetical protein
MTAGVVANGWCGDICFSKGSDVALAQANHSFVDL